MDSSLKEAQKIYGAEVFLLAQGIFEGKFSPFSLILPWYFSGIKRWILRQQGKRVNLKSGVTRKQSTPNFSENEHFLPHYTHTFVCVLGSKKCLFLGKFGMLCFLVTPVLRFALLPYYRRIIVIVILLWSLVVGDTKSLFRCALTNRTAKFEISRSCNIQNTAICVFQGIGSFIIFLNSLFMWNIWDLLLQLEGFLS